MCAQVNGTDCKSLLTLKEGQNCFIRTRHLPFLCTGFFLKVSTDGARIHSNWFWLNILFKDPRL